MTDSFYDKFFFFQAEDGIRDGHVTGVQTCALPISKTIIGRYTFAIGSNEEATALSGVNVTKWTIIIYSVAGIFTGVAGVVLSSRLNSAQPALGMGYELEAIAAVVIGGTSLQGGKGSIIGTGRQS